MENKISDIKKRRARSIHLNTLCSVGQMIGLIWDANFVQWVSDKLYYIFQQRYTPLIHLIQYFFFLKARHDESKVGGVMEDSNGQKPSGTTTISAWWMIHARLCVVVCMHDIFLGNESLCFEYDRSQFPEIMNRNSPDSFSMFQMPLYIVQICQTFITFGTSCWPRNLLKYVTILYPFLSIDARWQR